jgi:hypothetical protein
MNNRARSFNSIQVYTAPNTGVGALGNLAATLGDVFKLGIVGGIGFVVGHYFGAKTKKSV